MSTGHRSLSRRTGGATKIALAGVKMRAVTFDPAVDTGPERSVALLFLAL